MKFGGTSVADADAMSRVSAIVRGELERNPNDPPPVVVVSAMSKVTDRLIETARLAGQGDADGAARLLQELVERHIGVATTLIPGDAIAGPRGTTARGLRAAHDRRACTGGHG